MTERPILFSAPMVRALLAGTKTQTRRALRVQPLDVLPMNGEHAGREWVGLMQREPELKGAAFRCKFGVPGDRLWVRETWTPHPDFPETVGRAVYRADPECKYDVDRWRPSIHMPRWASRILLEIVSVRVERLQDISEADAVAEGIGLVTDHMKAKSAYGMYYCRMPDEKIHYSDSAVDLYKTLWEQINGAGSWDANPWVWVVEFKRVTP